MKTGLDKEFAWAKLFSRKTLWNFKGTIAITLAIVIGYLILSQGEYYIPTQTIFQFAFSVFYPQNILFHLVIHKGFNHLLANLISLVLMALVVESVLDSKDTVIIFVFSAIVAAIVFVLINPFKALVGASGGISGLLGAAIILNPKKALIAVIAMMILLFLFFPVLNYSFSEYEKSLQQKLTQNQSDLNKAIQQKDVNAIKDLNQQIQQTQQKTVQVKESVDFDIKTQTDPWIHGFGAIAGIAFVLIFRRKKAFQGLK